MSSGGEQGLLGLAFHPSYRTNGKLYLSYTDRASARASSASTGSRARTRIVSTAAAVARSFGSASPTRTTTAATSHSARTASCTSGSATAEAPATRATARRAGARSSASCCASTSTGGPGRWRYGIPSTNPFVGRSGLDQIWAYGLRNPWGFSFDRATGDLWIGDVGQGAWEEVDRALAVRGRNAGRGLNFGWRVMEGAHCYRPAERLLADRQDPAAHGVRALGRALLDHRRPRLPWPAYPDLVGAYLFGDYCSGEIWFVDRAAPRGVPHRRRALDTNASITSFGEDQAGELYLTDAGGTLYRVTDS